MRENKIYFLDDEPIIIVGLVEGYKGESIVVYRERNCKLALISYNEFISRAQEVEKL